jgi:hypothetical protein
MTAYLIRYGRDPSDRLAAFPFATRAAAQEASLREPFWLPPGSVEGVPDGQGGCHYIVETEEDVTFSNSLMVWIYNRLTGKQLGHFENREKGIRHLFEALPEHCTVHLELPEHVPTFTDREEHDAWIKEHATSFIATAFRGQPKGYDSKTVATLEEARQEAKSLYLDRPVIIYAVCAGRQVHVENYDPSGKELYVAQGRKKREPKTDVQPAPQRTRNRLQPSAFKPIRAGTSIHRILEAAFPGDKTMADIAQQAGLREDQVKHRLRHVLGITHGIAHSTTEDGRIQIILPPGKMPNDLVLAPEA